MEDLKIKFQTYSENWRDDGYVFKYLHYTIVLNYSFSFFFHPSNRLEDIPLSEFYWIKNPKIQQYFLPWNEVPQLLTEFITYAQS